MTTTCLHCGATSDNGLVLCDLCRAAASKYLEFLPVYWRNMARWRPGRAGSRPVPASCEPRGVFPVAPDPIERALDSASADLGTWVRMLNDDRGVPIPRADDEVTLVGIVCRLLTESLTSIATLDWAGDFVTGLGRHETALRSLTERVAPGWYAGACDNCEQPTHVVPGLTWVTCEACGLTTYARDHLPKILDEARGWVDKPKRVAEVVVALIDSEQSVPRLYDRIRQWSSRKPAKLDAIRDTDEDGDPVGPKRYRCGDVLDLIAREGQTRTRHEHARAS